MRRPRFLPAAAWAVVAMAGAVPPDAAAADSTTGVAHSAHVPAGYTLDWHDEFEGPLDAEKWAHFLADRPRGWLRLSRDAVSNAAPGVLILSASETEEGPVSAWITTQPSYRRTHGYFEIRARPQATAGLCGAFWLMSATIGMPAGRPWQAGAEIDVFSYAGDTERDRALSQGVCWESYEDTPVVRTNEAGQVRLLSNAPPQRVAGTVVDIALAGVTNAPLSARFHVFGLRWTEREYVFTLDGHETFRTSLGVSQVPQFLCLSLLPPPGAVERPRGTVLPASLRVDYVRVYAPPVGTNAPPSGTNAPAAATAAPANAAPATASP